MKTRSRYLVLDPHGDNFHLTRIVPSEFVRIVRSLSEVAGELKDACETCACTDQEFFKHLRDNHSFPIVPVSDVPELVSLGMVTSRTFYDLDSMPDLDLVVCGGEVRIQRIRKVYSPKCTGKTRIVCVGGIISGTILTVYGGEAIFVGKDAILQFDALRLSGDLSITLEHNSNLDMQGAVSLALGSFVYIRDRGRLYLGNGVDFGRVTIQCFHNISIGDDVLTAHDVEIRDGDGHDILGLATPNEPAPISIGNNVWLAGRSMVLKGVSIGDYSILATGSIATRSLPPHALAAGVPARVIREEITWSRDYSAYRKLRDKSL